MFQTLVRDYAANLTAEDKALAEKSIARLQGLVGTLAIDGAEEGAAIVVDGRSRGEAPLKAPIQVSAGSHVVRRLASCTSTTSRPSRCSRSASCSLSR